MWQRPLQLRRGELTPACSGFSRKIAGLLRHIASATRARSSRTAILNPPGTVCATGRGEVTDEKN